MNVARLQIVAAAVLFSTGGAAIKATSFDGLSGGIATACYRSGVAAIAIALFLPRSRRNWSRRTLLVGATFAVTLILFVAANKLTTSAPSSRPTREVRTRAELEYRRSSTRSHQAVGWRLPSEGDRHAVA